MSNQLTELESPAFGIDALSSIDPEIYVELKKLAARRMAQQYRGITYQPTMLVHEAWLRLSTHNKTWNDRQHFIATAAITMRHILVDNARRKSRLRNGGAYVRTQSDRIGMLAAPSPDDAIIRVDEGVCELEKLHPLRARVVIGRFFAGLTNAEIAESLGIGQRTVERHWSAAKLWLYRWMQNTI